MSGLRIETEQIEITLGGSYATDPDTYRRFMPGLTRYYIDDVEVSKSDAEAFAAEHDGPAI